MTDDTRQAETNGTATVRQTETNGMTAARETEPNGMTAVRETEPNGTTAVRETEPNGTTTAGSVPHPTLGDISHVNPYTNRAFGDTRTYGRGRPVAADGGETARPTTDGGRSAPNGGEERDGDDETLEDVDHTPEADVDGAQGSFDRGEEADDDEPDDE